MEFLTPGAVELLARGQDLAANDFEQQPCVQFVLDSVDGLFLSDGVLMVQGFISFANGASFTVIDHSICRLREYELERRNDGRLAVVVTSLQILHEPYTEGRIGNPQILDTTAPNMLASDEEEAFDLGTFHHEDTRPDKKEQLSWRMDSTESLSDWTIEIEDDQGQAEIYHVHKIYLGAGTRCSQYFARLFRSAMQESTTSVSRIVLQSSAAKAFPAFLDFVYLGTCNCNSENSVALRYLANYFELEELFVEVNAFIRSDLTFRTGPIYLAEASVYQDEKMLNAAGGVCAAKFEMLNEDMILTLPVELLQTLVRSPKLVCDPVELSRRLAKYCSVHDEMNGDQLANLTSVLETIDPTSALLFLKLSIQNPASADISLKEKSTKATAASWESVLIPVLNEKKNETEPASAFQTETYDSIPLKEKTATLEEALLAAHKDMDDMRAVIENFVNEGKAQQDKVSSLEAQMKRTEVDVSKAHAELRKYHRVPLDHDFETRYYNGKGKPQQPKLTRQESRGYIGVGMERFPASMPSLGLFQPHPNLGYIYDDVHNNQTKYWPVFYYKSESRGRFGPRR